MKIIEMLDEFFTDLDFRGLLVFSYLIFPLMTTMVLAEWMFPGFITREIPLIKKRL